MGERKVNWSLIAKKAWETRRKNAGKSLGKSQVKSVRVSERLSEDDKFRMRVFSEDYVVGDEWVKKNEREMVKKMRRKALMERALGVQRGNGICFGGQVKKRKVERGSWGVKIGD